MPCVNGFRLYCRAKPDWGLGQLLDRNGGRSCKYAILDPDGATRPMPGVRGGVASQVSLCLRRSPAHTLQEVVTRVTVFLTAGALRGAVSASAFPRSLA